MNYGSEWRQHRRTFHQHFNPEVLRHYELIHLKATRDLLRSVLCSPENVGAHLRFFFASITMRLSYGIQLQQQDDRYFAMIEQIAETGEIIIVPGSFLVDVFPVLRFLPVWFPGAGFKRWAAAAKQDILHIVDYLFETAKAAMEDGRAEDSLVTRTLRASAPDTPGRLQAEGVCKGVAAAAYAAGAETTNVTMRVFLLAMAMFPDVQRTAQCELDTVIGRGRLPTPGDLESLHYTRALVKELLRWHVVTPVGLPHRVVSDDEYNGYLIPAGATIVPSVWAMSRDPEMYPDPDHFIPQRFLNKHGHLDAEGKDPADFVFGFGRRICPGQHMAEATLLLTCASLLWAFEIGPPVSENGVSMPVELKISSHTIVANVDLPKLVIEARIAEAKRIVFET
ncbi:cytochrome P450 [Earliella scabrosa]|nr:cytochrome P450 [Earliella scabrosa]